MKIVLFLMAVSFLQLSASSKNKCRCQVACDRDVVDCYSAAGHVFGSVKTGPNTPRAILVCNKEYSTCSGSCHSVCNDL